MWNTATFWILVFALAVGVVTLVLVAVLFARAKQASSLVSGVASTSAAASSSSISKDISY